MSQNIVAERYAIALYQLAKEQNAVQAIENELRIVKKVLIENPEFITLLNSPKLSLDEKKNVIRGTFSDASPFVLNTLMLLTDRHREHEMVAMAEAFVELANKERGVAEAIVYSVRPLTAKETQAISATFASKVGKASLNIENIVDSDLLGGVKVRIGNRIFDGSLKGKLNRLQRTLIS